jgi:structural maintenance of chromosome 4
VNGLETTLETATSMLKSKGLDIKNNSFMVLQGEVEQVFLMKSKSGSKEAPGLLEFLEEIIGTSGLKEEMETIQD